MTQAERLWAAAVAAEARQLKRLHASVGRQRLLLDALLNTLPPAQADAVQQVLWALE